jgi:hypothetical protein
MKNDYQSRVWLLPHPGAERRPARGRSHCSWPPASGKHRRKFLQVEGAGISKSGARVESSMGVWTEYEAPTDAVPLGNAERWPDHIQTPCTPVAHPTLNTDPWIFQPGFVWSICGHGARWACPPAARCCERKACPQPGDIVLFGSSRGSRKRPRDWILDTVVVLERKLDSLNDDALQAPYRSLVEPTLRGARPYLGKKWEDGAPFSFAPCRAGGADDCRFARPSIKELFDKLRLVSSGRAPSLGLQVLTGCRPKSGGVDELWEQLTQIVWGQGLLLGVRFDLPEIRVLGRPSTPPPPLEGRAGCLPMKTGCAA